MSSYFLQIVTPNGKAYSGMAEKILLRTTQGDVCLLAKHTNYISALGMGECRVTFEGGEVRRAACIGGMVICSDEMVHVVASSFEWADEIDVKRAEKSKEKAEKTLSMNLSPAEQAVLEAKLKRALVRMKVHG